MQRQKTARQTPGRVLLYILLMRDIRIKKKLKEKTEAKRTHGFELGNRGQEVKCAISAKALSSEESKVLARAMCKVDCIHIASVVSVLGGSQYLIYENY